MLRCFMSGSAGPILVFLAAVYAVLPATATAEKLVARKGRQVQAELQAAVGYRHDNLDWNIAGSSSGTNPNILSELEWSDLQIVQVKLQGRAVVDGKFYIRGRVDFGWIVDGDNRDSDYAGDNRTSEFSRSINLSADDEVWDGSLGLGWAFTFGTDYCRLAPMLGYSVHKQNLRITDGRQVIPPTGSFAGLNSTYQARWNGPWIGFDLIFNTPEQRKKGRETRFLLTAEYHWADYYAEADWNLRSDFQHPKSFEHDTTGSGLVLGLQWLFGFRFNWDFSLAGQYQKWHTDSGVDRVFLTDGSRAETMLNEVNWESVEITAGFNYRF